MRHNLCRLRLRLLLLRRHHRPQAAPDGSLLRLRLDEAASCAECCAPQRPRVLVPLTGRRLVRLATPAR